METSNKKFEESLVEGIDYLTNYCRSRGYKEIELEVLVSDVTFLALVKKDEWNRGVKITTWLCGIANLKMLQDYHRKGKYEFIREDFLTADWIELISEQPNLYDKALLEKKIKEGVSELTGKRKQYLRYFMKGMKVSEIADHCYNSEQAVKTALFEARLYIASKIAVELEYEEVRSKIKDNIARPESFIRNIKPIGKGGDRRGETDNVLCAWRYVEEMRLRFSHTKYLNWMEIKATKLGRKHRVQPNFVRLLNRVLFDVKRRVYSLTEEGLRMTKEDVLELYREFKQYDVLMQKRYVERLDFEKNEERKAKKRQTKKEYKQRRRDNAKQRGYWV